MADPRDGSHECAQCKTKLNETDRSCWRCGCKNIVKVATDDTAEFELVADENGDIFYKEVRRAFDSAKAEMDLYFNRGSYYFDWMHVPIWGQKKK